MKEAKPEQLSGHVLVVDDDPILRGIAQATLQDVGLLVSEAEDGAAALISAADLQPDIILMDVMMPNMNGFDATCALRKIPEFATVPIMIMTALEDMESINRAYEVGATDFITKPINWVILVQRVRYMLRTLEVTARQQQLEADLQQAQKLEAVATLAGGVAHDFNNLLQTIQGVSELLLSKHKGDTGIVNEVGQIISAVGKGSSLTKQLLTYSRKLVSEKKSINLNAQVLQIYQLLLRTIPKMVEIKLDLGSDIGMIDADTTQIEQILMNLAINSLEAMPDGVTLTIRTSRHIQDTPGPPQRVSLSVSDNGKGMDEKTISHIFEPFFSTKAPGKGTGLGLSMVHGIVKNHDGEITCQSVPGEGTSFEMLFPVCEDSKLTHECQQTPSIGGHETILLVDDDKGQLDACRHSLADAGYTVKTATAAEQVTKILCADHIDLVILDIMMPGMGGIRGLEKFVEAMPDLKVLMASGHAPSEEAMETIDTFSRGFLHKPFSRERMLAHVRDVLDETRPKVLAGNR